MIGGAFAICSRARQQSLGRAPDVVRAQPRRRARRAEADARRRRRPRRCSRDASLRSVRCRRRRAAATRSSRPESPRVGSDTDVPAPASGRATMLNRGGAAVAASACACSGTSRTTSVGPAASAAAGAASTAMSVRGDSFIGRLKGARLPSAPGSADPSQIQSLPTVRAFLAALGLALVLAAGGRAPRRGKRVLAIHFGPDLEVNPVTQDYLTSSSRRPRTTDYDAAVILLDTPGGLSTSMKKIYTAELNAKLPVIVYVSPDGARAASAGVWIAQAADVLAMAPTTNIGSSTPIDSSGGEPRLRPAAQGDQRRGGVADRARRDAQAATRRGRRRPCARRRTSPRSRRCSMNVIDFDRADACRRCCVKLDGYKTKDAQRPYTLHLAGAHDRRRRSRASSRAC